MSSPPPLAPRSTATPLVPSPVTARERPQATDSAAVRIARLREAIRRTRVELDAREGRDGRINARFGVEIRPREETFTRAVCRLTERLVGHHESTPLAADERTLLGLWVNENLQSLAAHPFAPRAAADDLARRWRRHLGAALHPLDVPLASLYARQSVGSADAAATPRTCADPAGDAPTGDDASSWTCDAIATPKRATTPGATLGDDEAEPVDAATEAVREQDASDRLVVRLFRRLARVLHPDREPDATRRLDKHRLMSDCLRARAERDVDTLLSLHATHVGDLPEDLVDDDPAALVGLLRRQLDALGARLRRTGAGVALERLIVDRYGAADPLETDRRFTLHARALDGEIERFEDLERRVEGSAGLREALLARRELELDRLAIDELTGASDR